jgi:N,N-dimethylformamidase beta subunit-like protein
MRAWGALIAVAFVLASACQQGASPSGTTDGAVTPGDGGATDRKFPPRKWPPSRPGYVNPIPPENQLAGDPSWKSGFIRPTSGQLEAYADRVSAKAGEAVNLMVRSGSAGNSAHWTLYRIGWYGGLGARRVAEGGSNPIPIRAQPACPKDIATKVIRCSWAPTFSVQIPQDAVSGLYLVRIIEDRDGFGVLIPVVVKDERPADLLMESAVLTAQAYNDWGGAGLYAPSSGFAVQVSFDRPYQTDGGSGHVLRYEALMARFLERYGYDVTYTTNLDVAREGIAALLKCGAFLSVGHDEYWTGEQRDAVESAREAGMPIYFFGANAGYWKVRLSNPGLDGNARVVTCYKQKPQDDPLAGTALQTGRFRDEPISRPEEQLVGTMYESWMLFGQPWTAGDATHAMYEGTGLRPGDTIPQLVGDEYDRTFALDTPSPVQVVARSPLVDAEGTPGFAETTLYTAPSGALVFGAATIFWAKGLDGPLRDARVERITANLLQLGLNLAVPTALRSVSGRAVPSPDGQWARSVQTVVAGMPAPTGLAQLPDGTFVIADPRAHRIWQTDGSGSFSAYAGDGNPGGNPGYDNIPALSARFFAPTAVLPDAAGNVYVADTANSVIRKIGNDANRTVTSVAGSFMSSGTTDATGSAARFAYPMGMAWLDAKHVVIADSANMAIRVLDVTTRAVTTLAAAHGSEEADGPAASATFYWPTAVAVAPNGRVFFVASYSGTVKVIATDASRTITTVVAGGHGYADGPGTGARLEPQMGLLWFNGGLVVSDPGNQRLRWVVPGETAGSTIVKTWAGSGSSGTDDGAASGARFQLPLGLWGGKDGNVYVVDGTAGTLRVVKP